jgi:hypothetical protein
MAAGDLVRLAALLDGLHAEAPDDELDAVEHVARYVNRLVWRRATVETAWLDVIDPQGRV